MPNFTLFNNEPNIRTFSAGQSIFAEGQADDDFMYAVLEGEVDIVRQERLVETLSQGSVFGEMALLDNLPRSASAIAKTDCRVVAISEKRFTVVVSQNPHFALQMMRLLTERVRRNMVT